MRVLRVCEGEFAVSRVGVLLVVDLFAESFVVWYCYAVLFHGEFEVGEDFGFCVLCECCAFCGVCLVRLGLRGLVRRFLFGLRGVFGGGIGGLRVLLWR